MKYLVILCDGMADHVNPEFLGGKTPMQAAFKPNMDSLARVGEVGLCQTVAEGLKPGSDVANLSVLGYDPKLCYTGRSPLEAASIGIDLKETDVALRCNIVTLSGEENYEDKTMVDYCSGDISTAEAAEIIKTVEEKLGNEIYSFFAGVSYRHCLVVKNGTTDLGTLTPPHDISGRKIGEYLSRSENAAPLIELMKKSYDILKDHPVNLARRAKGLNEANSIWLWGEGRKPKLENFKEKTGKTGAIISAVDLLKGIGICAGMSTPEVEGATGYLDTNFEGKVEAAKKEFEDGKDLVYLHFEAPDECGHRCEPENKKKAIEVIDSKVVGVMTEYLKAKDDFRILIMPDHPTPLETKTHSREAVPYLIYDSRKNLPGVDVFTEQTAAATGNKVSFGPDIMNKLLEKI
ncbi:MAG: cofactor-independent phosphoglycerate mutase [Clostridiales bacterium]|nr:cofactor-independent phosphoglycerate mutase [Candidatus Equinaster intestinalis]